MFRRRILHIYSEKYAAKHKIKVEKRSTKYKLINALIGASGMAILFLPIISDVTSMTMVVSTDYHVLNSNIKDDP
ncbi:hypothetical protein FACS1894166_06470 [Bacilli bacterium]|nr:hypothetical protein FACS1894166_06470 [Bacilli bacterium]